MNTQHSTQITEARDKFDNNEFLARPTLSDLEIQLAHGFPYTSILYFLTFSNALIFCARRNLNSNAILFASFLGSFPIAFYGARYIFGYDKLRKIHKIEIDTARSAKLYEQEVNKKI
jgi:hypothetical protein